MIYRILIDNWTLRWNPELHTCDGYVPVRLGGPGGSHGKGLADHMYDLGLPAPYLTNERGRFCFTEHGWRTMGRKLAAEGRRRGHVVQVIRRKNPRRSQVLYRDAVQLAILPEPARLKRVGSG
jgi:hypothetical protein